MVQRNIHESVSTQACPIWCTTVVQRRPKFNIKAKERRWVCNDFLEYQHHFSRRRSAYAGANIQRSKEISPKTIWTTQWSISQTVRPKAFKLHQRPYNIRLDGGISVWYEGFFTDWDVVHSITFRSTEMDHTWPKRQPEWTMPGNWRLPDQSYLKECYASVTLPLVRPQEGNPIFITYGQHLVTSY